MGGRRGGWHEGWVTGGVGGVRDGWREGWVVRGVGDMRGGWCEGWVGELWMGGAVGWGRVG